MKVVAGYTLTALKTQVAGVAIKNSGSPACVDGWVKWFDGQQCDHVNEADKAKCKDCPNKATCKPAAS